MFLSTCIFNNLLANQIKKDSSNVTKVYLDDKILQYAEDSIKISVDGKIVHLYGNAKIEYQNMQISASIIEINWNENTITARFTKDSIGSKVGIPIFKEKNDSFRGIFICGDILFTNIISYCSV